MSTYEEKRLEYAWSGRLAFLFAALGSAIGIGNLFRYSSQAWQNYGLQWFIPYTLSLFIIGIPLLALEMVMGQISRSGSVTAFGRIHPSLRGMGLATQITGFLIVAYYNVIIGYALLYFVNSFRTPLPWANANVGDYFTNSIVGYKSLAAGDPGATAVVWPVWGCALLAWLFVFLCTFRGPSLLGYVNYGTMGLGFIALIIIVARGASLDNAWNGIKLYIATWRTENLASTKCWSSAAGQIFFSIGVCEGIFSAYSSYVPIRQNTIQDAFIVGVVNSLYEIIAAFAAFGVAGFLALDPEKKTLGSFGFGFVTYPEALARTPGSNAWSVIFFLTVFLIAIDSAASLVESLATSVCDSRLSERLGTNRRVPIVAVLCTVGALLSFIFSTGFGLDALNYVDKYTNEMGLVFFGWLYCFGVSYLYRVRDIESQVGWLALCVHCVFYVISPLFGVVVGYFSTPSSGFVVGIILAAVGLGSSIVLAKDPEEPRGLSPIFAKLYWLNIYSCDQFRLDVNDILGRGAGNWMLPFIWGLVLKFLTAPLLMIILSFSFNDFVNEIRFPEGLPIALVGFGFFIGISLVALALVGLLLPDLLVAFLPPNEEKAWKLQYSATRIGQIADLRAVVSPAGDHHPDGAASRAA